MQNNYTYLPMVCIANEIQVFFFFDFYPGDQIYYSAKIFV